MYDGYFIAFWDAYPRKVGKDAAYRTWKKLKIKLTTMPAILAAIASQERSDQWRQGGGRFIPHPATWLNEGRWKDEVSHVAVADLSTARAWRQDRYDGQCPHRTREQAACATNDECLAKIAAMQARGKVKLA